jgi:hypothetical protein
LTGAVLSLGVVMWLTLLARFMLVVGVPTYTACCFEEKRIVAWSEPGPHVAVACI